MKRLALGLLALTLLAGCGIKGGLERPDPLWGEPDQASDAGQPAPLPEEEEREDPTEPTLPGPGPTPR